jgi:hypothetical protein
VTDLLGKLEAYADAWNVDSAEQRDCRLAEALDEDIAYVDPSRDTRDRTSLSAAIGDFRARSPGATIVITGAPEIRSSDLRLAWNLQAGGSTVLSGLDYQQIGDGGQIAAIWSYWDPFADGDPLAPVTAYVAAWNASDEPARSDAIASSLSNDVRWLDGKTDVRGATALGQTIETARASGLAAVSLNTLQSFGSPPTHARVSLTLTDVHGATTNATDYLRFDEQGRIEGAARFIEK